MPVTSRGERIGTVVLAADPEPLSRRLTRYLVIGLLVLMAALVVGVLGIAQSALRRANRELEERADALAARQCRVEGPGRASAARPRSSCARPTRCRRSASSPAASPMISTIC